LIKFCALGEFNGIRDSLLQSGHILPFWKNLNKLRNTLMEPTIPNIKKNVESKEKQIAANTPLKNISVIISFTFSFPFPM